MSEIQTHTFQIKKVTFPRLDSLFISPPTNNEFDMAYRVEGLVINPTNVRLLFGVKIVSKDKVNEKTHKLSITVEAIGDFEFNKELPDIKQITDVPLAANMLALMYPFIREKVYSCFANNDYQHYLPPINTIQLLKDNVATFKISDKRGEVATQVAQP